MYCSWLVLRPGLVGLVTSGGGGLAIAGGSGVAEVTVDILAKRGKQLNGEGVLIFLHRQTYFQCAFSLCFSVSLSFSSSVI